MSSTLLERARALEEDIEQYEEACSEVLMEETKRVRGPKSENWRSTFKLTIPALICLISISIVKKSCRNGVSRNI